MAAPDARAIPRKNAAYRVTFPILDADGDLVTAAAGLDSEVSVDGGTFADALSEATEIATASGMYFLDLTAAEMNGDTVAVIVKTTTVGAKTTALVFYPQESGDVRVDVDSWGGVAVPTTEAGGGGVIRRGTAQGGAASAVTLDAGASATDDFYQGTVELIGGTGAGQAREITDYVGATKVATTDRPWVVIPDATSVFRLYAGSLATTTAELVSAVHTTAMTESYSANNATKTPAQALYEILALLSEFSIAGTTITVKRMDGATTALTLSLDSATTPTAVNRAS